MSNLHTKGAWVAIRSLVRKRPHRCQVAVAYFGVGASDLLPLRSGSILVVDLSPRAVRSGQTKPAELSRLVKLGVEVYSVENLHAKVFVIGRTAIVGSTNVSGSSANRLIEAAVETSDKRVVSACRNFVLSLRGEIATPQYLKTLQKLYRPPKFGFGSASARGHKPVPHHAPLWVVPLELVDRDAEDDEARGRSVAKAKPMLQSRHFQVDDFMWSGTGFVDRLEEGKDLILEVTHEGRGRFMVSEPARLLHIERYKKGREPNAIITVELSRKTRRTDARRMVRKLGLSSKLLKKRGLPRRIVNANAVHNILNLWRESGSSG